MSPKSQAAYLHDMLEAARLIRDYTDGVSFEDFLRNNEKRDAVAMRISVLGESAHKSIKPPKPHCLAFPSEISVACATVSSTTTAQWISRSYGP